MNPPRIHCGQKLSPLVQELMDDASERCLSPFNGLFSRWEPPGRAKCRAYVVSPTGVEPDVMKLRARHENHRMLGHGTLRKEANSKKNTGICAVYTCIYVDSPGVHLKDGPHTYATHCGWHPECTIALLALGATRLYHLHAIPFYHGRGRREVVVVDIPLREGAAGDESPILLYVRRLICIYL